MIELEGWVPRDEDGMAYLYLREPQKVGELWAPPEFQLGFKLGDTVFPEIQWSDEEPTRVKLTIEK